MSNQLTAYFNRKVRKVLRKVRNFFNIAVSALRSLRIFFAPFAVSLIYMILSFNGSAWFQKFINSCL